MSDKNFKVKSGLQVPSLTTAGPVVTDSSGNVTSSATLPINQGGTGQTTAGNALNALLPLQTGNDNKYLQTNGVTTQWNAVAQQTPTDALAGTKIYTGTTTPATPAIGDTWIDSSAGNLPTLQRWAKTAAGGETSFSGIDDNNITLTYVVGTEQVYLNGILLVRNADYTATNGTSISFTSALVAGDSVNVLSFLGGSVADTYTQAQANSTFYPTATTQIAGKNKIINGDFSIWQRGTTVNLTAATSTFLADRWTNYMDSNAGTVTYSRQSFTPGSAPVVGYEGTYFARLTTGGNVNIGMFGQNIEDVRTLAGQTVTISFWMRTSTPKTFTVLLRQNFGTGGSSLVDYFDTYTTSTNWQRFTKTFTLNSISGKTIGTNSSLFVYLASYSSQVGNFDIDVWGVQLEAGSIATTFTPAGGGSQQAELALCQRYYFRYTGGQAYSNYAIGNAYNGNTPSFLLKFPTTMRTIPTALEYSNLSCSDGVTGYAISSLGFNMNQVGVDFASISGTSASGLTQYRMYFITNNNNAAGYIGCSAEL